MARTTHTVTNQPLPGGVRRLHGRPCPGRGGRRHLAPELLDEARESLALLGRATGSEQVREWGEQANENPPRLRTHDRYGHRVGEVHFHPAWHRILGRSVSAGLTDAWGLPGGHVRRAAGFLVATQAEAGHGCPLSMTHAAVPALRIEPELAGVWSRRPARTCTSGRCCPSRRSRAPCSGWR